MTRTQVKEREQDMRDDLNGIALRRFIDVKIRGNSNEKKKNTFQTTSHYHADAFVLFKILRRKIQINI